MSVDVDGLKQANDRYGHDAGDDLLCGVAGILRRNLRDADVVARIGGDEFGVLLPETKPDAMPALVERIKIACAAWRGTKPDLRLSVSIGWAAPEPFGDLREALRTADDRMYLAKRGA
jgi:diguanylate cyclase (GGDEF)-like protein